MSVLRLARMPSVPAVLCLLLSLTLLPLLTLSIPLQPSELTPTHPRTLILSTSPTLRHSHSLLLSSLTSRQHSLTLSHPYDEHLHLHRHGQSLYDNLVLFTDGVEDFTDNLSMESLVQFVDEGHNVVVVWGERVSEPVRLLAYELGVTIAEDEDVVVDHFHVDHQHDTTLGTSNHTYITSTNLIDAEVITGVTVGEGEGAVSPILFHGLSHTLALASSSASSHLYIPILRAEATAVSPSDATPLLVSAYQTRSNARVLFLGSALLLSNAFQSSYLPSSSHTTNHSRRSGNGPFSDAVLAWTFRERGMLRARQLVHHQVSRSDDVNPHSYRVSDYTAFSITIEEFNEQHDWVPFIRHDIPLAFTMIDPYIRHPLTPHSNGSYTTAFQIPDVYGVYKFVVDYRRPGYSALHVSHQVSVTPYRHDQYERFLWVAYPYYAAAFTLMAAFLVFGWVFLYGTGLDEWAVRKVAEVKKVTETHAHYVTEVKRS